MKKTNTDQSSRGRTIAQIAESEGIPDRLAEVLLLDGKSDAERMKHLSVGIQPYDVWSFSGCDPRFGAEYPGRVARLRRLLAGRALGSVRQESGSARRAPSRWAAWVRPDRSRVRPHRWACRAM